jgi:uncharacterized membrane protein YkgB
MLPPAKNASTRAWFKSRGLLGVADASALLVVNLIICHRLLRLEYLDRFSSIEGAFISLSSYIKDHWNLFGWFPLWYGGMPLSMTYQPGLPYAVAAVAAAAHISPATAYHTLIATTYSLGAVTFYMMALVLIQSRAAALYGALFYSLFSPSLLFFNTIRTDAGGFWNPRRLQALVVYGEGPNVTGLSLLMLSVGLLHIACVRRTSRSYLMAAVGMAAVVATSWPSTVALAMACASYIISYDLEDIPRALLSVGKAGIISIGLAAPFALPTTVRATLLNTNAMADAPTIGNARWVAAVILLTAALALRFLIRKCGGSFALRFSATLSILLGGLVGCATWFGVRILPQPVRFHLAFEIGFVLTLTALLARCVRRWTAAAKFIAIAFPLFIIWQFVNYRSFARAHIRAASIRTAVEYESARWFADNMPNERVAVPGTVSFWMNVFTSNPQLAGCCEQSIINPENRIAAYIVSAGYLNDEQTARLSTLWLKAYAVHAIELGGPTSREFYKAFKFPYRFKGGFSQLWHSGEDAIYAVPHRPIGLARVVRQSDLVSRAPVNGLDVSDLNRFVTALDDPLLPTLSVAWHGPDRASITGTVANDQIIELAINYHPWWRAWNGTHRVQTRADGLGFIVIEPECSGPCHIELEWAPGMEASAAAATAIATLGIMIASPLLTRKAPKSRPRPSAGRA